MNSKPDAWIPIYIGDYLKDTSRLTTEQHGAYLLLIFDYWCNGPSPDDDYQLAGIAQLNVRAWRKNRPALVRLFRVVDGVWRHKRIDTELEAAATRKKKAIERAEKAAKARWGDATSIAQAILEQCPSPSPLEEEGYKKPSSLQRRPSGRAPVKARPSVVIDPEETSQSAEIVPLFPAVEPEDFDKKAAMDALLRELADARRMQEPG